MSPSRTRPAPPFCAAAVLTAVLRACTSGSPALAFAFTVPEAPRFASSRGSFAGSSNSGSSLARSRLGTTSIASGEVRCGASNRIHIKRRRKCTSPTATSATIMVTEGWTATALAHDTSLQALNNHQLHQCDKGLLAPWASPMMLSESLADDPTKVALFALGGLAVAAAGFSTAVYWRMQYVVAALLSNRVPSIQGGAEVLELSAKDTKTLYYMPTGGVRRLTLSTVKDLEQEIVNGAAIQAKIPTALVRKQEAGKISCTTGTMDCVVSIFGFSSGIAAGGERGGTTTKSLAMEAARVLKPGGTLLFVEKGDAKQLVQEVREALGSVEVNIVQNLVDPYCVALGTKTKVTAEEERASGARSASPTGGSNRAQRRRQKNKSAAAGSRSE